MQTLRGRSLKIFKTVTETINMDSDVLLLVDSVNTVLDLLPMIIMIITVNSRLVFPNLVLLQHWQNKGGVHYFGHTYSIAYLAK